MSAFRVRFVVISFVAAIVVCSSRPAAAQDPPADPAQDQLPPHDHMATMPGVGNSWQFMWDGIGYYLRNTGIPVNFGITILVALIVGTVVAGQTFYLFTVENLKQFGALKAMGVTNPRLVGMILLQAVSVAALGFGLGTGMAATFFEIFRHKLATRGIVLLWQCAGLTGACILFVVAMASILSIRRVLVLEPAEVFR